MNFFLHITIAAADVWVKKLKKFSWLFSFALFWCLSAAGSVKTVSRWLRFNNILSFWLHQREDVATGSSKQAKRKSSVENKKRNNFTIQKSHDYEFSNRFSNSSLFRNLLTNEIDCDIISQMSDKKRGNLHLIFENKTVWHSILSMKNEMMFSFTPTAVQKGKKFNFIQRKRMRWAKIILSAVKIHLLISFLRRMCRHCLLHNNSRVQHHAYQFQQKSLLCTSKQRHSLLTFLRLWFDLFSI